MVAEYVNEVEYVELPLEPAFPIDSRVIYTATRRSKARVAFVRDYDYRTGWFYVEYWIIGSRGRAIASGGWVPVESISSVRG